jgi:hypothetical protein
MPDTVPYIFFMKKGDISTLQEFVGVQSSDSLVLNANISCITTAVSELENEGFAIYPNPVSDRLYVISVGEKLSWEIFNTTGQLVLSGKLNSKETSIDMKNFASGIYTISIKNNERISKRNFVKMN